MNEYVPFLVAYIATAATPGVEAATIMGFVLAGRGRAVVLLAAGLLSSKVLILMVALLSMTALAHALGPAFHVLRYVGAAWLVWMAIGRIRRAFPSSSPLQKPRSTRNGLAAFGMGAALTFGNPLALTFYFAILPAVVPEGGAFSAAGVLSIIVTVVMGVVIVSYAVLARLLRGALTSRPRAVEYVSAALLLLAAALTVVS